MRRFVHLKDVTTLRFDAERCNGCGMCVKVCPHEVFGIWKGRAFIIDRDYCMECGACARNCARNAIDVKTVACGCATGIIENFLAGSSPEKSSSACGCGSSSVAGCGS